MINIVNKSNCFLNFGSLCISYQERKSIEPRTVDSSTCLGHMKQNKFKQ